MKTILDFFSGLSDIQSVSLILGLVSLSYIFKEQVKALLARLWRLGYVVKSKFKRALRYGKNNQ